LIRRKTSILLPKRTLFPPTPIQASCHEPKAIPTQQSQAFWHGNSPMTEPLKREIRWKQNIVSRILGTMAQIKHQNCHSGTR